MIESIQRDVLERVIFLQNRKKYLESELLLLANRRLYVSVIGITTIKFISSYATHEHQIRSEVHTTECTDHWKPTSCDQIIEEFYSSKAFHQRDAKRQSGSGTRGELVAKRRYAYNNQTKHFDVILEPYPCLLI